MRELGMPTGGSGEMGIDQHGFQRATVRQHVWVIGQHAKGGLDVRRALLEASVVRMGLFGDSSGFCGLEGGLSRRGWLDR
jgi:hypothetical protein